MNLENLRYMAFAICTDNQLSTLSGGLFSPYYLLMDSLHRLGSRKEAGVAHSQFHEEWGPGTGGSPMSIPVHLKGMGDLKQVP